MQDPYRTLTLTPNELNQRCDNPRDNPNFNISEVGLSVLLIKFYDIFRFRNSLSSFRKHVTIVTMFSLLFYHTAVAILFLCT